MPLMEMDEIIILVREYVNVFANSDLDPGYTNVVQHSFNTVEPGPCKQRPHRITYNELPKHKKEVN